MPESTPSEEKQKPNLTQEIEKTAIQSASNSSYLRIFLTLLLMFLLFGTTALVAFLTDKIRGAKPVNFEECAKIKSSIIQESYPAVCTTKDGLSFTQEISEDEKSLEFELENNINTSDWETYKNVLWEISFKHPKEFPILNSEESSENFVGQDIHYIISQVDPLGDGFNSSPCEIKCEKEKLENPKLIESVAQANGVQLETYNILNEKTSQHYITYLFHQTHPSEMYYLFLLENPDDDKKQIFDQILTTFKLIGSDVQGVSTEISCLQTEQKILEEVNSCEEVSEEKCLALKEEFDECLTSCQENLGENECFEICKPVCDNY